MPLMARDRLLAPSMSLLARLAIAVHDRGATRDRK
jgi:hypothetical protein